MKKTAIVFSHAHWDVEWYMPYRYFRFWLTDLLDNLMSVAEDDPRFHTYVLDGQVAPVDHYLAVNPQNEEKVRALIRDGKLTIGPFYTQYDEWLISGEAIVRNTLHGLLKGKEYGETMNAGYLPDNFGHPLQMPQILRGFGLDGLIFMRGMPDKPEGMADEFNIKGLDGTCVLGVHLQRGYGNALNMWARRGDPMIVRTAPYADVFSGYESHIERTLDLDIDAAACKLVSSAQNAAERHPSGVLPLAAGSDHCPPIPQIAEIIKRANELQDDIEFVQGDCDDIVRAIKESGTDLSVYDKELWGSRYQYLLTGTLTTRSYIKQANFAAENILTQYAEPIASIASVYGKRYPDVLLQEAWDCMYLNQAHDSIHGSSVDAVHREMMQRYDNVTQICAGIVHDGLKYLGTVSDGWYRKHRYGILTFSPPSTESDSAVADTWVHTGDDPFHLEDKDGNCIPVQVLDNPFAVSASGESGTAPWPDSRARHILFEVPGGANSISSLAVVDGDVKGVQVSECFGGSGDAGGVIENGFVRVEFSEGALVVTDKVSGRSYAGLGVIEDEADDGDAWDFSRTWSETGVYRSDDQRSRCRLVENGPVRWSLLIQTVMKVPRCLVNGKRSRKKVELPITMRVSLCRGARRVEVMLELDNQAKDHRLRLKCPTGIKCDSTRSQGHFGVIKRPLKSSYAADGWKQPPADTFHFRDWVAVDDGRNGIAVACKGLCEYEAIDEGESGTTLYVTLLRGIGRMSKVRLRSRSGEASPAIPIPEAQCLGVQRFEYAFIPYGIGSGDERLPFVGSSNAFLYPPVAHVVRDAHLSVSRDAHPPISAGIEQSLFELSPGNLVVSAFKLAEDANGYILRFWENEGRKTVCHLRLSDRFTRAYLADLREEVVGEVGVEGHTVSLEVGAFKIVTLRLLTR